jgi:integrase
MRAGVPQAPLPVHGIRLVDVGRLSARVLRAACRDRVPPRHHGLHSLRGALAVAMLQADTPPPVVTAVLGHTAATTTAAHYLRLDVEHLRRCALDVEDVLAARQGARS